MNEFCWIGIKESDILFTNDFFDYAVVIFGNDTNSNYKILNVLTRKNIDHNNFKNDDTIGLFNQRYTKETAQKSNVRFMFYNQHIALKHYQHLLDKTVCLNSIKLIEELESKIKTREHYKAIVPTLPHQILDGNVCKLDNLKQLFKTNNNRFVLQKDNGSGGSGTILYSGQEIDKNGQYLVTQYCEKSIPINTHLLITKNEVIVMPSSIQIIESQGNHLKYKGCDFIGYKNIDHELQTKELNYAKTIGEDLQKRGYLGIVGIDSIIVDEDVYFIEINPRFQNSSTILNKCLVEHNLPSLQEINYYCFTGKKFDFDYCDVDYSSYVEGYGEYNRAFQIKPIMTLDYNSNIDEIEQGSYKRTLIFDKSIYELIHKDKTETYKI